MTVFEKKQAFLGTFSLYTAFLLQYGYNSVVCDASLICFQIELTSSKSQISIFCESYVLPISKLTSLTCAILFWLIASSGFHIFLGCLVKNVCVLCFESMWLRRNNRPFLSGKAKSTSKSERFRGKAKLHVQEDRCRIARENYYRRRIAISVRTLPVTRTNASKRGNNFIVTNTTVI